jgi:hypothetical protein
MRAALPGFCGCRNDLLVGEGRDLQWPFLHRLSMRGSVGRLKRRSPALLILRALPSLADITKAYTPCDHLIERIGPDHEYFPAIIWITGGNRMIFI